MFQLFLIASGGAAGAITRYAMGVLIKSFLYNSFYATSIVNILGSFLIGYLISIESAKNLSEDFIKFFLIIGFLGSFTTFSSFSYESIELFSSSKIFTSLFLIILSVILCIFSAFLGMYINKLWLRF